MLSYPFLLLPSIFPSIRVFPNESAVHIRWPKYWSFSFSISPSNKHSGFISFRIDWFDLLAVQGNLKSLLQHDSLKASILHCSAFFMVQPSHPYMTTGKTLALTVWTFVSKVISLLFNTLSRLITAFLPRSKHLLKNLPFNAGDTSLIPELGRSHGEGNGNPLQYSCLGNPMDREAWWAIVHGVARELDYKEGWAVKDWCFRTAVLEKTLQIPWTARSWTML